MSTVPPSTPTPPGGGSYTPPPPPPPGGTGGPASSDRTLMLVLSYLGILSLIPYLMKKDDPDPELRWHAKNGVGLLIFDIVVGVVFWILGFLADSVIAGLGCGVGLLNCVVWLGLMALHIYCIIKAVGGQRVTLPVITDFAQKNL